MDFQNFVTGSSVISALPTLLYMGFYRRKNRLNLLVDKSGLEDFLSIPYESLVIGILVAYGVSFAIMKKLDKSNGDKKRNAILVGAGLGLTLSLIGRHVFDLPVKHFGMTNGSSVHLVAPILYALIFVYYLRY